MYITEEQLGNWQPVLENEYMPSITDPYKRDVTVQVLENTKKALEEQQEALQETSAEPVNVTGNVSKYDPVLISLIRRTMPNLIAFDVAGVQPMTGPTGLIFAMRPKFVDGGSLGDDAFYNEPDSDFSGTGTHDGTDPGTLNEATPGTYTAGDGLDTTDAELLGTDATGAGSFAEMGFEIEKVTVSAKSRALKANYTVELAQDLKQIHGLDAETELSNILSTEILAEINREVIRKINIIAKKGADQGDLATSGVYDLDVDADGRWSVEKFKGMLFQLERDANAIAKGTRRGRGNFIMCSSNVASALRMAGMLDNAPRLDTMGLQVDDTGNTFAGVINGQFRVYVDPYATADYYTVGYRGNSVFDAGLFYAPYVPLQLFKAIGEDSFQPRIGFKTRYGLVANPFAEGTTKGGGSLNANKNEFYRRVDVRNLHGGA